MERHGRRGSLCAGTIMEPGRLQSSLRGPCQSARSRSAARLLPKLRTATQYPPSAQPRAKLEQRQKPVHVVIVQAGSSASRHHDGERGSTVGQRDRRRHCNWPRGGGRAVPALGKRGFHFKCGPRVIALLRVTIDRNCAVLHCVVSRSAAAFSVSTVGRGLESCCGGNNCVAQPAMGGNVVEAAMPHHDAAQFRCFKRKLSKLDWIGAAKFLRELPPENCNEVGLDQNGACGQIRDRPARCGVRFSLASVPCP